jgi:peptidoglycan/xylan/chitin deacetylase (PgdA/CDA1 family)
MNGRFLTGASFLFSTVMRPPYGNSNSATTQTLNKLGYTIVTWSVDSKDYVTHNLTDELANYKSELGPVTGSNGGIALEHDVRTVTK